MPIYINVIVMQLTVQPRKLSQLNQFILLQKKCH